MRKSFSLNRKVFAPSLELGKDDGPYFGSKEICPLFPRPLWRWLSWAGISLCGIVITMCVYQVYLVFFVASKPTSLPQLESQVSIQPVLTDAPAAFAPFIQYADILKRRDVFKIFEKAVPAMLAPTPRASLAELAADLSLSGILFEKEPQAIIEDKKSGKVYVLKKGEYLNNIKIEHIERGKVRLRLDTETLDLEM